MSLLIYNTGMLVQTRDKNTAFVAGSDMADLPVVEKGWLLIEDDIIAAFGTVENMPSFSNDIRRIDAGGGYLFPAFCDPHTHLVYAGSREKEYTDRIRGLSYEEIARRGGGILNSCEAAARHPGGGALQAVNGTCQGDHHLWYRCSGDKKRLRTYHRRRA